MTTIKDVATLAGVTPSTVSRVINNTGRIGAATRQRVQQAIVDSGYQFNRSARALVTKSSGIVGFVTSPDDGFFYASLLQALSQCVLSQYQQRLMLEFGHGSEDGELAAINRLLSESCEAIIVYSRHIGEGTAAKLVQENKTPIVFLNRFFPSIAEYCVSVDNVACGYMATRYLIDKGHQHIACIYGCAPFSSGEERLEGFRLAMHEHNLAIDPDLLYSGYYLAKVGWDAVHHFQPGRFTAIFSCSSGQSVGAINALQSIGYSIPKDVSLISIDNHVLNDYMNPALTAVEIPFEQLAKMAMHRALLLKAGKSVDNNQRLPGILVERASVADADNN